MVIAGMAATSQAQAHEEDNAVRLQGASQEQVAIEYHPVRGIFLGYDGSEHRITVAHEAIPEVMMAMRMHLALPDRLREKIGY